MRILCAFTKLFCFFTTAFFGSIEIQSEYGGTSDG